MLSSECLRRFLLVRIDEGRPVGSREAEQIPCNLEVSRTRRTHSARRAGGVSMCTVEALVYDSMTFRWDGWCATAPWEVTIPSAGDHRLTGHPAPVFASSKVMASVAGVTGLPVLSA